MSRRSVLRLTILDRFRPRTDRELLRRAVRAALALGRREDLEVALLLTDDSGIAELHGRHLGDATPTDVMSFLTDDTADLVVNVQRARREARRRGTTIRGEVALYVIHGLLHLCGFDDHAPRARARMRAAEQEVLAQIGLRVAPVDAD
ncbi:MAG: rRNA maturation RNase YbeY [Planctomycetota bacterium]